VRVRRVVLLHRAHAQIRIWVRSSIAWVCYRVGADDPCRRSDGARQLSLSLTPVLLRCFLVLTRGLLPLLRASDRFCVRKHTDLRGTCAADGFPLAVPAVTVTPVATSQSPSVNGPNTNWPLPTGIPLPSNNGSAMTLVTGSRPQRPLQPRRRAAEHNDGRWYIWREASCREREGHVYVIFLVVCISSVAEIVLPES